MKPFFVLIILLITASVMSSCAYNLRKGTDTLPGGVKSIQIPLFKNYSSEAGAEIYFTNSLKSEALRSRSVILENEDSNAEGILQGTVSGIQVIADESIVESPSSMYLPSGAVLALQYKVIVTIDLTLKKRGSNVILWSGNFKQIKNFPAAQITLPVINTSNSLYNESAKRQTLDAISKELMQAAFDRLLEKF